MWLSHPKSFSANTLSRGNRGTPWGQTRSWSNSPGYAAGGSNGSGWVDTQLPHLLRGDGATDTTLVAVANANASFYFDQVGGSYQGRFFDQSKLVHNTTGTNHEFDLTDTSGGVTRFDDFSSSLPAAQRGQFEGYTDPGGNALGVVAHTPTARWPRSSAAGPAAAAPSSSRSCTSTCRPPTPTPANCSG
jgi:hypothetical protein